MKNYISAALCCVLLLACSKESEEDSLINSNQANQFHEAAPNELIPKTGTDEAADWGLNQVLRTDADGPGSVSCVSCFGPCDCYDVFNVVGMADLEQIQFNELLDAINQDQLVSYFGDAANESNWNTIFNGQLTGQVLSDLQDGITTLIWFSEDDGETVYIAIQYADGTDHPGYE